MATYTAAHAAASYPVPGIPVGSGLQGVAWGVYTHASNLAADTVIRYCRVPKGATVIGGFFQASDIDTGTAELDISIGWEANGVDDADVDGFGALGVLTGDASVHLPVVGVYIPFNNIIQEAGFKTFAAETILSATINVDAQATGTGVSKLVAFFI